MQRLSGVFSREVGHDSRGTGDPGTPALSESHAIVLVDDNPAVPAALRRALRGEPYTFFATTRPDVALDWIGRGGVSLVVMGQRMAGIGGPGLAERVRRISPGTVRVVLTADAPESLLLHGLADEVEWVVGKPWDDDSLRRTFRRLLRDHEPGDLPLPRPAGIDWDRIEVRPPPRCVGVRPRNEMAGGIPLDGRCGRK